MLFAIQQYLLQTMFVVDVIDAYTQFRRLLMRSPVQIVGLEGCKLLILTKVLLTVVLLSSARITSNYDR